MTDDNRDKLIYIAGKYKQTVKFYNVEELCKDKLEEIRKNFPDIVRHRWSIGSYYPFLIPDVFPSDVNKVIYLDTDTIVNLDIITLWKVDMANHTLAVIPNILSRTLIYPLVGSGYVKKEDYFNSGVYVMNIEKFKSQSSVLKDGIKFFIENPTLPHDDERILNYCFSADTVKLPTKFNFSVVFERPRSNDVEDKIVHYAACTLNMDSNDVYNRLFFKYFMKTPFHTEKTFGNIYSGIQKLYNDQKNLMLRVANFIANKTSFFCATANNVDKVKKLFAADDSAIITVNPRDSKSLFEIFLNIKANQDKGVYIFVADKYAAIKKYLVKQGLQEWTNFIDGTIFFSEENGGKLNSAFIVAGM